MGTMLLDLSMQYRLYAKITLDDFLVTSDLISYIHVYMDKCTNEFVHYYDVKCNF